MKTENSFENSFIFKDAEDKLLFAKATDRMNAALKSGRAAFTDFLDAARCAKFLEIFTGKHFAREHQLIVEAYGGTENSERKMIGFRPPETASDDAKFPIMPVTFTYNKKFSKPPSHRDYLGAVLGLQLDRGKIGDICISSGTNGTNVRSASDTDIRNASGAVMYVQADIAAFISESLTHVGRVSVKGALGEFFTQTAPMSVQKRVTVPSLRLDAVIGAALNLSRGKSAALIDAEKVFVNWKFARKTYTVNEGDTITIRGTGRVVVKEIGDTTKKGRIVLCVEI